MCVYSSVTLSMKQKVSGETNHKEGLYCLYRNPFTMTGVSVTSENMGMLNVLSRQSHIKAEPKSNKLNSKRKSDKFPKRFEMPKNAIPKQIIKIS